MESVKLAMLWIGLDIDRDGGLL